MNRAIQFSLVITVIIAILLPLSAQADDYQNFSSYMDNGVKSRYNPNLKTVDAKQNPLRRLMNSSGGNGSLGMAVQPSNNYNTYSSGVEGRAISLSNVPPSKSAMAYSNQYRPLPGQKFVRPVVATAARTSTNSLTAAMNASNNNTNLPAARPAPVNDTPSVTVSSAHNNGVTNTPPRVDVVVNARPPTISPPAAHTPPGSPSKSVDTPAGMAD